MPEELDSDTNDQSQGHPAWQEILSVVPEELHPLLTPKLQEWDQGVQAKLQDLNKYQTYQPLVDNNVPLDAVEQALYLAHQFENNPEEVVARAIEAFNLEQFKQGQQTNGSNSEEDEGMELDEENPLAGLENHPAYKQLLEKANQIEQFQLQQQEAISEEQAASELREYLDELHEEHGEFNDLFVTALLANGVEADEAVNMFQETVKTEAEKLAEARGQTTKVPPPVVMGGAGTTGSGSPDQTVRMGDLSKSAIADIAAQFIQNAQSTE
jgi:hypothetical protein